jgi:diaminohydroxyphosphoribosylaminopyrimidine deaminase/5-amino-6-(5-phosphoribosylamino)uracil reductase
MGEEVDNKFMRRCLELASGAKGLTYPNPLVGSVIVSNGVIIGEGFHIRAGEAHAEINAINSVADKSKLESATLYVNLEPCSHFGKTPPCADFIISSRIPRVVIGTTDTTEKVSGKGVERLRKGGCEVVTGVLEEECRKLNRRFFTYTEKRRPYIILKWAESSDGYIDHLRNEQEPNEHAWISGNPERVLVHKWRSEEQAILVGAETIRSDNPRLNVREWKGRNPARIILSSSGKTGKDLHINETNGTLIVFTHNKDANFPGAVKVILDKKRNSAQQIADYLYVNGIQSLFIEGGTMVLDHFIETGLWDEARIFKGKTGFGGGVKAPVFKHKFLQGTQFSGSSLGIYLRDTL